MEDSKKENEVCPQCNGGKVRKIAYGRIGFKNEIDRKAFEEEHVLGGCEFSPGMPHNHCDECSVDF